MLTLLRLVGTYLQYGRELQAVGVDILNRIVDALNLFNSRCCQLVLGAGAMQLVGLKNITAKHLALASQCLGLVICQIPAIRQALTPLLPGKQANLLNQLDLVSRDYEEHRREIFGKLVTILSELVERACVKLLTTIQQSARSCDPNEADPIITRLMESTRLLHRALSGLLAPAERDAIFRAINGKIDNIFTTYLVKLEKVENTVSKDTRESRDLILQLRRRIVSTNVRYVLVEIRKLDGCEPNACRALERFIVA
eukprot:TRINITY_DN6733_c0_g1_i5.p1 TRINITY_DN6733_c0_g1~~TRINITY_DN6733_c0_g1_i5.p1  ORF type:complete len:255 (+),score=47.89 TRINITY_DN6733_c0_g1_i5:651-1415(+)